MIKNKCSPFLIITVFFLKALARFISTTKKLKNKMLKKKKQAASMSDDVNQV